MLTLKKATIVLITFLVSNVAYSISAPNPQITPGVLCTPQDPDFKGYDYPSKVARCNRNIGTAEKLEDAKNYGNIPESEWSKYEFDHFIPLCAGGSNSIQNLWPQPIAEAKHKDVIEVQVCTSLKAGTMTQPEAVQKIHEWFNQLQDAKNPLPQPVVSDPHAPTTGPDVPIITKKYVCVELKDSVPSKIKVNFAATNGSSIDHLQVALIENNGEHELLKVDDRQITGQLSKAQSGPLLNFLLFAVKANQDRFDFYLPQNFEQNNIPFTSYFKIVFEDSYPNLVSLTCSEL